MSFIKAGFTGGFLGIVIGITDIFVNSLYLEKAASLGLWLADSFGKVCINTQDIQCTMIEKFTTILATIVGNCIAYFVLFALLSLGLSVLKMWFTSKPAVQEVPVQQAQAPPQIIQVEVKQPEQVIQQEVKEKRPKKKAKVSKSKK